MLINNIICIKCKPDFTFFSDFFAFYNNIVYLCRKQSYNKYLIYKDVTTIKFKNLNI